MDHDGTWHEGGPRSRPHCATQKAGRATIFGRFLLWPKGWMHQDATWYGGRHRHRPHCARWGPSSPQKGAQLPQFFAHVYYGQTTVCIRIPFGTDVGLSLGDVVLDGDPAAPIKRAQPLQFLAHVYCGQTAGWIKMLLGTAVDLGPGHIVLDGDPAPPAPKGHSTPLFPTDVYCGHGRPSQVMLCSCLNSVYTIQPVVKPVAVLSSRPRNRSSQSNFVEVEATLSVRSRRLSRLS